MVVKPKCTLKMLTLRENNPEGGFVIIFIIAIPQILLAKPLLCQQVLEKIIQGTINKIHKFN